MAWLAVKDNKLDLLLSDIVLPGTMSGIEIAQHVRNNFPATKIIFMSGYAEITSGDFEQFVPRIPLLNKPFTNIALATAVAEELAHLRN